MDQERVRVTDHDRRVLGRWIRAGTTPQRVAWRARIVLLAADGCSMREIARRLGVSAHTVSLWRRRFQAGGPEALVRDAPGRGRKPTVTRDVRARMHALLATSPPSGRWTVRALAAAIGASRASVHRVLKTDKLPPGNALDQNGRRQVLPAGRDATTRSAVI
jgi:transposase